MSQNPETKIAKYRGGEVTYSVVGDQNSDYNPIAFVRGISRGQLASKGLAKALNQSGQRQVLIWDQPLTSKNYISPIRSQAEALLAVLEDSDLASKAVDFIAHSFGALILWKAAEIAKKKNMDMTPFDAAQGSRSIFLAPAGSYGWDNPFRLRRRFNEHMAQSRASGRAGQHPAIDHEANDHEARHPLRHIFEGLALGSVRLPYHKLGELGLRPMVFAYPNDLAFPHELTAPAMTRRVSHSILGYAMLEIPNGAHDDPIFNPGPTARAVLQELAC